MRAKCLVLALHQGEMLQEMAQDCTTRLFELRLGKETTLRRVLEDIRGQLSVMGTLAEQPEQRACTHLTRNTEASGDGTGSNCARAELCNGWRKWTLRVNTDAGHELAHSRQERGYSIRPRTGCIWWPSSKEDLVLMRCQARTKSRGLDGVVP